MIKHTPSSIPLGEGVFQIVGRRDNGVDSTQFDNTPFAEHPIN